MAAVTVNMTGIVQVGNSALHIRDRASMSGRIIGYLYTGNKLTITKKDGDWCYATETGGWSHSNYIDLTDHGAAELIRIQKEENERRAAEAKARAEAEAEARRIASINNQLAELENHVHETYSDISIDNLIVGSLNGIYGIPYQFMDSVDPRLQGTELGRKYADKIISKMPLLCITPGKVEFMSNFSKPEQKGVLASLIDGEPETPISSIIKNNGRYFTFAFAYQEYFDYVNGLCRVGARFLNIHDVKVDIGDSSKKLKDYDWKNALNAKLKASLTSQEFIGFYMDSTDSVSESFSNTTTESQLSSTINGVSDLGREIGFLLGAGAGKEIQVLDEAQLGKTMASIEEISNKYLNGSRLFKDIANNFATVATGGKLLFPEIWADSTFSRSFDINIKLRTPDNDTLSWYLNIYVPLCHLIALAAGHQTDNANGYHSPFLIRAFYKGLFNIDMGIVTDLSISKGKEAAWTVDGLPTEVDVNLTIKDLYNMMAIVQGSEAKAFVTNNILMDYVANTCGININKMDIMRSIEIYGILTSNKILNLPNTFLRKFQDAIDTYGINLYNAILNKFLI